LTDTDGTNQLIHEWCVQYKVVTLDLTI